MKNKESIKEIQDSILNPYYSGLLFTLSFANLNGTVDDPLFTLFNKKWPRVAQDARYWWMNKDITYKLGNIKETAVQSNVWVMQMLCKNEKNKVDLNALKSCLENVCKRAKYEQATVHVSQLLLDEYPKLEKLLITELVDKNIKVYKYVSDVPTQKTSIVDVKASK